MGNAINLSAVKSPIILRGDEITAYRDPAILYTEKTFYLFYTLIEIEDDGKIYSYTASSKSADLVNWTNGRKITPRDQSLNYSSPGNVIRFKHQWILCLQSYPRPGYVVGEIPRFADETARIFTMRSTDLENWSAPELLCVKGPGIAREEMGRMIDPFLIPDRNEHDKWWCFYKQNGVSMSYSYDLVNWTYSGSTESGENVCVLVDKSEYILFHSPSNGIGIKKSKDLKRWRDWGNLITLGQKNWPWAKGRLTAGTVADLRDVQGIGKYLMFFHGSGPETERVHFDNNASIGIAWSDDLINWAWPGKPEPE